MSEQGVEASVDAVLQDSYALFEILGPGDASEEDDLVVLVFRYREEVGFREMLFHKGVDRITYIVVARGDFLLQLEHSGDQEYRLEEEVVVVILQGLVRDVLRGEVLRGDLYLKVVVLEQELVLVHCLVD